MESKYKRNQIGKILSKVVSIEETVIESASEILGKSLNDITDAYKESESHTKLYNIDSEYYQNDINIIVAEFLIECREKYGWRDSTQ